MFENFMIFGVGTDNPILVSPQRVLNRRTQFVENNQHQDFIDSYLQIWNEFEVMFEPLRQEIIEATNNANGYISNISNEIYFHGVRKILIETAEAGHSIDHFFQWVKKVYESFADDEKNLGIEEWGHHEQSRSAQHH